MSVRGSGGGMATSTAGGCRHRVNSGRRECKAEAGATGAEAEAEAEAVGPAAAAAGSVVVVAADGDVAPAGVLRMVSRTGATTGAAQGRGGGSIETDPMVGCTVGGAVGGAVGASRRRQAPHGPPGCSYSCRSYTEQLILTPAPSSHPHPLHTRARESPHLPAYLPAYLPTYLPACLPIYLPTYHLPTYLPACLPAYLAFESRLSPGAPRPQSCSGRRRPLQRVCRRAPGPMQTTATRPAPTSQPPAGRQTGYIVQGIGYRVRPPPAGRQTRSASRRQSERSMRVSLPRRVR